MNFKHLSSSTVFLFALGAASATACGGSIDIDFVGADDDGGNGGGDGSCGDGAIAGEEECDDENDADGDGCSAACTIESGYSCTDEPSECAQTVGNGDIDDGETCDDGNVESGDGCSDTGQIEGSCDEPIQVDLEANELGNLTGRFESSTTGGGSQLPNAPCAGDDIGQGPDRVFQIEVPSTVDLRVRVESTFNPLVRLLNAPCDLDQARTCSNEGGVGADEDFTVNNLPAGTYYIAVDGAQAAQSGDFTLRVDGNCPLESLKLSRVNFYRGLVEFENTSTTCSVPTDNITLGIQWDEGNESEVYTIPSETLAPGEVFSAANYVPTGIEGFELNDPYPFPAVRNGEFYLCRGNCNLDNGNNVIDAFVNGDLTPAIPSNVTFDAPLYTIPTGSNTVTMVYERFAYEGSAPDFLGTDWHAALRVNMRVNPFTYDSINGSPTAETLDDPDEGRFLRISAPSGYSGYHYTIPAALQQPTYFSYRFRRNNTLDEIGCYALLGTAAGSNDVAFLFAVENTAQISQNGNDNIGAFASGEWVTVELRDFNWTDEHMDVYFNGDLIYENRPLRGGAFVGNLMLGNAVAGQSCDYSDVVLY